MQKLDRYFKKKWLSSGPVHAGLLKSLEKYTAATSTLLNVDRTPLPYCYVQVNRSHVSLSHSVTLSSYHPLRLRLRMKMTSTLLVVFVLSLPFSLAESLGAATPAVAALVAYAYGGLYINACNLRNPFNTDDRCAA